MTMATKSNIEELLKKLEENQQAYFQTIREVHEALAQPSASSSAPVPSGAPSTKSRKTRRRSTCDTDVEKPAGDWVAKHKRPKDGDAPAGTLGSSVITGDSDESDVKEEFYVQEPLPSYKFDFEDLKEHLRKHKFDEHGQKLLESVVHNGKLQDPRVFPEYSPEELWHQSHYSVFDVDNDGAPLSRSGIVTTGSKIDSAIWQAIQVKCDTAFKAPPELITL
jgi:hypothetical protein